MVRSMYSDHENRTDVQGCIIFSGAIIFDPVHSKRCGMSAGGLSCPLASMLTSLGRVGVAWRPGEVPGMTYEPAEPIRIPEAE